MPILIFLFSFLFATLGEWVVLRAGGERPSPSLLLRRPALWRQALLSLFAVTAVLILSLDSFTAPLYLTGTGLLLTVCVAALTEGLSLLLRLFRRSRLRARVLLALAFSLLLSLGCECLLFNYRHFMTRDYTAVELTEHFAITNAAGTPTANGFTPLSYDSMAYVEATGLSVEIKNLYLELEARAFGAPLPSYTVIPAVTDAGNATYYPCEARTVYPATPSSRYLTFHLSGQTERLSLRLLPGIDRLAVHRVAANVTVPFFFSVARVAAVFFLSLLVFALRPRSALYGVRLFPFDGRRLLVTALTVLLLFSAAVGLAGASGYFHENIALHQEQYNDLADALLNGHLHLFRETPPAYLAQMENPYDPGAREELERLTGHYVYWDAAYYNGNYYVYFGVLPCLLLYLPYRALTGRAMPNAWAILFFALLLLIATFSLLYELIRRFSRRERVPLLTYLLLSTLTVTAVGLFYMCLYPDMYSVPIMASLAFAAGGLSLWLRAARDAAHLRPWPLALGSLCMAATTACRPQLFLLALLALPIFFHAVFRERSLLSRRGWRATLAFCLPFVAVALPLLWYNAARFSSPFDFGANYNLTTNDMTLRGFRPGRIGSALFTYLLQPPAVVAAFPFLEPTAFASSYLGVIILERTYGGLFAVCPFALLSLAVLLRRGRPHDGAALSFAALGLGVGVFIALFDAQGAGLLQRYFADFALPILLGAALVFLSLLSRATGEKRRPLRALLLFCFLFTSLYQACLLFTLKGEVFASLFSFWG